RTSVMKILPLLWLQADSRQAPRARNMSFSAVMAKSPGLAKQSRLAAKLHCDVAERDRTREMAFDKPPRLLRRLHGPMPWAMPWANACVRNTAIMRAGHAARLTVLAPEPQILPHCGK